MSTVNFYLKLSRPRFWIYLLGPYLVGLAATGDQFLFTTEIFVFLLFFLFPANFFLYGINDIFDYETDRFNPKKVEYEVTVTPKQQKKLFAKILLIIFPFFIYSLFISVEFSIILLIFTILSFEYSAPPIRAKTKPFLDMLFNSLYILPAFLGYLLVTGSTPLGWAFVGGVLWAMAMHAYSAVPDIQIDKKAGMTTIATFLGFKKTLYLCVFFYVLAALIGYSYLGLPAILLGFVYVLLMIYSLREKESNILNIYKIFPVINTISGGIIFLLIFLK